MTAGLIDFASTNTAPLVQQIHPERLLRPRYLLSRQFARRNSD